VSGDQDPYPVTLPKSSSRFAEFKDMLIDPTIRISPTFAEGLRFSCTRCGACCKHVGQGIGLVQSDLKRLGIEGVDCTKVKHPVFAGRITSSSGSCYLLTDSSECKIYQDRPLVCRLYPFYISYGGDGSMQLSVDHCPGVNSDNAELVDKNYISRELLPSLLDDSEFVSLLREQISQKKKAAYALIPEANVEITWVARTTLWKNLLALVESYITPSFSPRDVMEILKCDVLGFVLATLTAEHSKSTLEIIDVTRFFTSCQSKLHTIVSHSIGLQKNHKIAIQEKATIVSPHSSKDRDRSVTFRRRVGDVFSVPSHDLLKFRELTSEAIACEFDYILEVLSREFVYMGVIVEPLNLCQETALLFYLADAIELTANALAIVENRSMIDTNQMDQAISEVDATILSTVSLIGGKVANEQE
jgi:uncharacterized protein